MASNGETVADIIAEIREIAHDKATDGGAYLRSEAVGQMLGEYADSLESTHKREIAKLQDWILALKDTIAAERAQYVSAEARKNAEYDALLSKFKTAKR